MKCYVFLLVFCILSIGVVSEVSAVGVSNGIVTDTNDFEYSYVGDGVYSISSDMTTSQFGFAISGNYNGQPIIRSFNDLTWNNPVKTNVQDGFKYNIIDTSANWDTQFTFTNDYTKIQNTITNPYTNDITNAKFWYVMDVDNGDVIAIAEKRYTVKSNSNIHITDSQYDLNVIANTMRVNDVQLNYQDLIDNGFDITDLRLMDGGLLGYPNTKIIAVGFTKDNSVFVSGSTIVIDPTIENGFDGITTYTGTDIINNFTLNFNEINTSQVNVTISNISAPFGNWTKYKTITFTNPPTVNNYQARITVTHDNDMQSGFEDLRFEDGNGNPLNYNILEYNASTSATVDVLIPNQESSIQMQYGNPNATDDSDPSNTYIFYDACENTGNWGQSGSATTLSIDSGALKVQYSSSGLAYVSRYMDQTYDSDNIIEWREKTSSTATWPHYLGPSDVSTTFEPMVALNRINGGNLIYYDGTQHTIGAMTADTWYRNAVRPRPSGNFDMWYDISTSQSPDVSNGNTRGTATDYDYINTVIGRASSSQTIFWIDDLIVREYLATEPTAAFGSENDLTVGTPGNITVSVIGDSHIFTDNGTEILIPTADINNVAFVANNTTQYDYAISLYWTEDFVIYTETVGNGFANYSVSYTPSENITSGAINATYSQIDFSEHDYIGNITATLDGSPVNTTRENETISIQVSNLNTSSHDIFISIPYNPQPTMIYPNGQTLSFPFPPLNHDVPANWTTTTGQYRYTVTTQGGVFVAQDMVNTNETTFTLPAGDYFWYVQGYDDVFDEYSSATTVFNFTVQNDYSILNTTAIVGVVYSQDGQTKTPITNAVVTITNDTWSNSVVVGADGFYSFVELAGNETYFLQATAEYFDDSGSVIVTTTPNNVTQRDILLTTTTTDYVPHFVKFVVKDIFGNKFSDVESTVHKGPTSDVVAFRTGTTGVDGSVTFRLDQNVQYTLTFVKTDEGISETLTLYPKNDFYNVYTIKTIVPDDEYSSDLIDVVITKELINNTNAYINVSYNDSLAQTTQLTVYLNQSNSGDIQNQSVIDSWVGVSQSENISFIVSDYTGQSYFVNVISEHSEFGTIQRSYSVTFGGMADDKGFSSLWIWLGIGAIMFTGLLFKATNAQTGAVVVCGVSWTVLLLGWLDNLGSKFSLAITAGLTLATVLAIAAVMAKGRKEG